MSLADTGPSAVIWIGLGLAAWLLAGVVVALTVAGMLPAARCAGLAAPGRGPPTSHLTLARSAGHLSGQVVPRPDHRAGPVGRADTPEQVADVNLDGALGDGQASADQLVRQSLGNSCSTWVRGR